MVKDPVCKMEVEPNKTQWKTTYEGVTYYFCSEDCLKTFQNNPQKYVGNVHEHKEARSRGCC
ncbi:MAG: YHS domain-containing protein [Thermoproteota archaeon]|nr:YHS domain-containing protein [Candidatus Brockarchaeota archaeon]